jgi:hypothetical protein
MFEDKYTMSMVSSDGDVTINKTQTVSATELSDMFLCFLQATGFNYIAGVQLVTNDGNLFATDGFEEYEEKGRTQEPTYTYGYGAMGEPQPYDVDLQTSFNFGSSIDDATPEEWDAVGKKL